MSLKPEFITTFGIQVDAKVGKNKKQSGKSSLTLKKIWGRNTKLEEKKKESNEIDVTNI